MSGFFSAQGRRLRITALFAFWGGALERAGAGAAYPERSIRLIVPFAAGSAADTLSRVVASGLADELGQGWWTTRAWRWRHHRHDGYRAPSPMATPWVSRRRALLREQPGAL